MDPVTEIKARLPIEQLVSQYCQLKSKGRNFVAVCPFHNDHKPSMLVSPDKGIAYCFACSSGGDIFSFYQKIEGVDFPQALRDLAEKTGVTLPKRTGPAGPDRDERDRLKSCVSAAHAFFRRALQATPVAQTYLAGRGISAELIEEFELGFAPDSFADTYQHLLKQGYSRSEIVACGLAIQKNLADERIYDRFRNRIIFPIHDIQGTVIAFGGRTIGDDDAKYINSSEGPLYRKSAVLFGLHRAREAIRESKRVVMVEGYFDVLACWRIGIRNAVAVSGTALTEEHVRILKRTADSVVLCLDADRAGQDAAERAFTLCSREGLLVLSATITAKDPDEAVKADAEGLRRRIADEARPYLAGVVEELRSVNLSDPSVRRTALQRVVRLLAAVPSAVDREQALRQFATVFSATETALEQDVQRVIAQGQREPVSMAPAQQTGSPVFSASEITLALLMLYPNLRTLVAEMIAPDETFAATVFAALQHMQTDNAETGVDLPQECRERMAVLQLYCEEHHFHEWAESLARMEIRKNIQKANRDLILRKQREVTTKLQQAKREGRTVDEAQLQTQYLQILRLIKMAK